MNTNAPKNESATDWQGILSAAADLQDALAYLRPALAKAARNGDLKYREIGEPLRVSTNRAWTLINQPDPASLEDAESFAERQAAKIIATNAWVAE